VPDYPDRLGVFPLPRLVAFPHLHLPLHVFEPRYRALLADALGQDGRFVVATLRSENEPPGPAIHPWACAGRVVKHQTLGDGRSDLVWRGERVVRLAEIGPETPYRVAQLAVRAEDDAFAREPGAAGRLDDLRVLLERACPGALVALESRLVTPVREDGGLELLHTLASTFPVPTERKLAWLESADTLERWLAVRATLESLAAERTRKDRALSRYADLAPEHPRHN
jgi:Lon protease-like protein